MLEDLLMSSYDRYVRKYGAHPDICFISRELFSKRYVQDSHPQFMPSDNLILFYGCVVLLIDAKNFSYMFFESDDLFSIDKQVYMESGDNLIINKLKQSHPFVVPEYVRLEVPLQIIDRFDEAVYNGITPELVRSTTRRDISFRK